MTEICAKDGETIYTCPHTYCEECGSTEDVCGDCLRCVAHEGQDCDGASATSESK